MGKLLVSEITCGGIEGAGVRLPIPRDVLQDVMINNPSKLLKRKVDTFFLTITNSTVGPLPYSTIKLDIQHGKSVFCYIKRRVWTNAINFWRLQT